MALLPREIWAESGRLGLFRGRSGPWIFFRNTLLILIIL
jgi:hypothetical protein